MIEILQRLLDGSVIKLTRAACVFALFGLALMSYSIIDPRAIPVITAMSLGHAFGIGAFGCYLFAVVLDTRRSARNDLLAARNDTPPARHSVSTPDSRSEVGSDTKSAS
jgi:hypothetical protein